MSVCSFVMIPIKGGCTAAWFLNSFRKKLILAFSLFITVLLAGIAWGTHAWFKHQTQQMIFREQFAMISSLARGLDDKILSAHNALIAVAKVAPASAVSNHQQDAVMAGQLYRHCSFITMVCFYTIYQVY